MPPRIWKDAEEEFVSFFASEGKRAHVQRLTDTAFVRGSTGNARAMKDAQPSDFIVTWKAFTFYSEVKSTQNEPSFPFSMIKKNQWVAARCVTTAGGSYYFWLRREATNQWYIVPANVFIDHTTKSMRWDDLESYRKDNFITFKELA